MPWREVSVMDQRREFVRLAMQEGVNRRELCRRFGIHPDTGYKWLGRWQADQKLADRSRRPHSSPQRTDSAIEERILAVRDTHPAWGARKIAHCLKRAGQSSPAVSTVHEILRRAGRINPPLGGAPASQRFEMPAPNLLWQMDFKGWVRLGNDTQCHPLTVVDDHSRYDLCLQACADQRGETVRDRLELTFRRYGLPEAFFVDNGPLGETLRANVGPASRFGFSSSASRSFTAVPTTRRAVAKTNASTVRSMPRCSRCAAFATSPRPNRPSMPGAKSIISSDRMKRSGSKYPQVVINQACEPCRIACRRPSMTATRSYGPYRPPKPMSASKAGFGRSRRHSAESILLSALSQTASGAFSSPPIRSLRST